ncbi:acyltransferase [Arthrobacter monumenti]
MGGGCLINRDGYIRAETTIGNNVFIGPFARLITDSHTLSGPDKRAGANQIQPILIGDGTWVGASVTILGGVTIGRGSVIAAGSVVTKDVPNDTLVGGVPAQFMRDLRQTSV